MTYQFDRLRVLVVEDNLPMLEICKTLLMTFGIGEVFTAKNGDEGFNIFCKENPDFVLADWMMSPMDGISLTRRIRNDPRSPNHFTPVILMTGFSERKRVIQARDAGVTEFLVKPFTARDLYKRVSQLIERPRQFVRCEDFFGPDRRRKPTSEFQGPFRRDSDKQKASEQRDRMKEASVHLDRLRENTGLIRGGKFEIKQIDLNKASDIDFE